MIVRMKNLLAAALLALVAVPVSSMAQQSGWYAGLGLGMSTFKGACDDVGGPGISCDDGDTAFKLMGGYQINKNFAVEFGYADFGKAKASQVGVGDVSISGSAYEVLAVGMAPINPKWSVLGKVGVYRWDVDLNDGSGLIGSASASGTSLTYGIGVNYDLSRNAALRLEYQLYNDAGDEDTTSSGDASVIGLTAIYRF